MLISSREINRKAHQKVLSKIADHLGLLTSFVSIFTALFLVMNWPAYSRILQGWIDADVLFKPEFVNTEAPYLPKIVSAPSLSAPLVQSDFLPQYHDLGVFFPNEMRLEVPKVFSGTIPIQMVDIKDFQLKDLYAGENRIQEALRSGVVHYPYTANPSQFGNVFITGHSSYYPWDKGNYKDIFATLANLRPSDQYFIYFKGKKYSYQVSEIFEVQPDDVSVLEQPTDKKISTLMTCTPVGTVLRRLIVRAELVGVG